MRSALAFWCRTRSASVLMPRCRRKQACGSSVPPRWFSLWRTFSIKAAEPATAPATMSEWPFRYLVQLWRTRSMPTDAGRKLIGLANVLSTRETSPFAFANFATAGTSATWTSGFEIVST